MNPEIVRLVQESWGLIMPIAPQAGALFYNNLFELDPSLRPLFKGDIESQSERLMQMMDVAVSKLGKLDVLIPVLQGLGTRHVGYGVQPHHYDTVGAALLKTLEQGLGETFTPQVRAAWEAVYEAMARVMAEAQETRAIA